MSKLLDKLRGVLASAFNCVFNPPFRIRIGLAVSASLLFILYFQFFYGPVWATFFVLSFVSYAGAVVFFGLQTLEKRADNPDDRSFSARILRREDLRHSLGFWLRAVISLFYAVFCLLAGRIGHTHSFDAPCLYSMVLVLICLIIGNTKRKDALHPETTERRDRNVIRAISVLLPLLAIAFAAMSAETILNRRSVVLPAFVLTFQILFTAIRFFLYGVDSIRSIGTGNTLLHMIADVNLTIVLVALYTTIVALLSRFCPDDGTALILSVLSGALILCAILRIAVIAIHRAWRVSTSQPDPSS